MVQGNLKKILKKSKMCDRDQKNQDSILLFCLRFCESDFLEGALGGDFENQRIYLFEVHI